MEWLVIMLSLVKRGSLYCLINLLDLVLLFEVIFRVMLSVNNTSVSLETNCVFKILVLPNKIWFLCLLFSDD